MIKTWLMLLPPTFASHDGRWSPLSIEDFKVLPSRLLLGSCLFDFSALLSMLSWLIVFGAKGTEVELEGRWGEWGGRGHWRSVQLAQLVPGKFIMWKTKCSSYPIRAAPVVSILVCLHYIFLLWLSKSRLQTLSLMFENGEELWRCRQAQTFKKLLYMWNSAVQLIYTLYFSTRFLQCTPSLWAK